ncbi:MAG: sulfite exporter TauE/SafE family protein [Actinomycetota bacterium]|nr:sulfite exporter TauE/SafE family protein [Actinomycetota bacterium]MDQ6945932.1 sulfite exporter TauE/SafE family protein [Actinomycetota bacterium]
MNTGLLDIVAVGGAGVAAGAVNAMAGGGTLIAFPCLVALGVPTVSANITVTVGQTPGYLAGAWTQRADLGSGLRAARRLAVFAGAGALAGALLLQVTPDSLFKTVVPFLILAACAALVFQDRVRDWVKARPPESAVPGHDAATSETGTSREAVCGESAWLLPAIIALGGIYGGFFGAGLGIMILALLGLFSDAGMVRNNAVKQVLAFVINLIAAAVFAVGRHVSWSLVPSLAIGSIIGGIIGARTVHLVRPLYLRTFVVLFGLAVAIDFWVG